MPRWRVTDPNSGMTISVESDTEPTDEMLDAEFASQKQAFMGGSKASMGTNPKAIRENLLTAGGTMASVLPFVAAPRRAAGAAYGAYEGSKAGNKEAGPIGGALGALGGGVAGAVKPGTTGVVGAALGGLSEGSPLEALVGAGLAAVGLRKPGVGKNIAREVAAAKTAADVAKAVPKTVSKAVPALDDATQKIVQQLQQQMGTVEGRSQIRQLLSQMDPRQASQIKDLLARGLAQPGTTASGGVRSVTKGPKIPAGYGEELARLLGQVE